MKELAAWYQKKISSYDKEEWEMMVEQLLMKGTYRRRIVDFSKQARPYLIDVDLVRGSSFPKAKPSLSVRRVVWFALARLIFLPLLYRWWSQQTSPVCAKFLLTLWALQFINLMIYVISPVDIDVTCWLVPLGLMVVLSVVHSQIVSTTELELAKVRPHSTYRRKIPRYIRRARSECEGGGSAESAASNRAKTAKPTKFRRRHSRAHEIPVPTVTVDTLRKRKSESKKDNLNKNIKCPDKVKPLLKFKAKDSDDEDYMAWKKPEVSTPIVTFTPPPDEATPSSSFEFRENVLTKKRLESFNVKNENGKVKPRACLPDGDDGFESLNGNNSNGSDAEKKESENTKREENPRAVEMNGIKKNRALKDSNRNLSEASNLSDKTFMKTHKKNAKLREVDSEDGTAPTAGARDMKRRAGVRFRNSWVQEMIEHASSDDVTFNTEKCKTLKDYQSSTSEGECSASAPSIALPSHHTMSDWIGQTTNSEESSYGSQTEDTHAEVGFRYSADSSWDPFVILNPTSDTVKCTMWERGETLRTELSAVDISWYVVARAERAGAADGGYLWAGLAMAAAVAALPPVARFIQIAQEQDIRSEDDLQSISIFWYLPSLIINYSNRSNLFCAAFGDSIWEISANILSCVLRLGLGALVFFLLAVAERAYKQRFLYAKLFSHLTSARRARKSELPHFRLNTVRNIKTWLSTRSYLRRRGPQRSVDVIVSAAFVLTIVLLACVSAQLLRESVTLERGWLLEAMMWVCCLGVYLLRLLTLGNNVNRKYRGCLSTILTEQINLHLAIEQRPESKEQLTLANNVLKLAADLLKSYESLDKIPMYVSWTRCNYIWFYEKFGLPNILGCIDCTHVGLFPPSENAVQYINRKAYHSLNVQIELDAPFKISGICANHYLYTITKVVILSALSGVLSEMLGFKLKLHKIKIK